MIIIPLLNYYASFSNKNIEGDDKVCVLLKRSVVEWSKKMLVLYIPFNVISIMTLEVLSSIHYGPPYIDFDGGIYNRVSIYIYNVNLRGTVAFDSFFLEGYKRLDQVQISLKNRRNVIVIRGFKV